jgi:uncharacterized repeat protein (TIGR01451 family)
MKTSSVKSAKPLDVITYNLIYFNPGSSTVFNAILVDNLPPPSEMSYVNGSASNGGVYSPSSNTLTWNIPSIAPGISVTLTYQIQVGAESASASEGGLLTNKACLSFVGGGTVCASSSVSVIGAYLIQLAVYNQAGELMDTLATFEFPTAINDFTLQNGVIETDTQTAQIIYNGVSLGTWNATNSIGAKVTNGTYFIKINSTDPVGVTTTVTKNVIVDITRSTLMVAVYNEAGEIVKHFSEAEIQNMLGGGTAGVLLPADFNVQDIKLSSNTLVAAYGTGGTNNTLTITLGSGRSFTWDGTGDDGQFLLSGTYFLEVSSSMQNLATQQIILPVHILNNGVNAISGVVLAPNPISLKLTTHARFLANTQAGQVTGMEVRIYTIAGELMRPILQSDPSNPTEVDWDLSQTVIASGTYLAVVEMHSANNGVIGRQILKVQVVH